jgi:hypothetical protein
VAMQAQQGAIEGGRMGHQPTIACVSPYAMQA